MEAIQILYHVFKSTETEKPLEDGFSFCNIFRPVALEAFHLAQEDSVGVLVLSNPSFSRATKLQALQQLLLQPRERHYSYV